MEQLAVHDMRYYIQRLVEQKDLSEEEAGEAMRLIMSGKATQSQIGGFLTAMRMKGVSVAEVTAFAKTMKEFASRISPRVDGRLVDMCGTGGDAIKTFNISTTASFVVAAAGIPVAKHGNRSVTSKSGSADVLEALGARIDLKPCEVEHLIEEIGFGFMYAPVFHGAMKHALAPRKEIGIRTVFNLLGPLTNPASAKAQVMGVYDEELVMPVANVLKNLGVERAMVVHGAGGLDEASTFGPTYVCEVDDGRVRQYTLTPEELGLEKASVADLRGGDAKLNAEIAMKILGGARGPKRDVVLLNASCGIYVGGKASSLQEAMGVAAESVDSGAALEKLKEYVERSRLEAYV
ncbi:anthranilate phosphoribosyltransferase [Methanocella conradii HZ254]|uniref:Anthranilate phosphoribosyltransferase n=1 Tax=Methanocella conradii (strain DSM 24694 / JCM 17849 / CGMCC 1.5162 / HZ254) TaxID=1041930 RepID=H8IA80_METCZ|nr:anthranilate phosphoribosyltransferase [Methanocella conradii]AFC99146.1 anthranilate phosphoribosyltransferase [Methanocella conradii HZ254]